MMGSGASKRSSQSSGSSQGTPSRRVSAFDDVGLSSSDEDRSRPGSASRAVAPSQGPVPETVDPEETWLEVRKRVTVPLGEDNPDKEKVVRRRAEEWRTIRIFVSSTFTDFHYEREILIKEVFQDLRVWCQKRRLRVVDIDLRWGVPEDTSEHDKTRICLEEIDKCAKENTFPYFINLTGARSGWIPKREDVEEILLQSYDLIYGLSVTEMEIIHGAYRINSPNSMFLIRDMDSYHVLDDLQSVDKDLVKKFVHKNEQERINEKKKLDALVANLKDRFKSSQILAYKCRFVKMDSESEKPIFEFEPDVFRGGESGVGKDWEQSDSVSSVLDFFKKRISEQYPVADDGGKQENVYERAFQQQEAFVKLKCQFVLGRDDVMKQIRQYVQGTDTDTPLLILGAPGSGKSAMMAKAANRTHNKMIKLANRAGKEKRAGKESWQVFYHFVGAVPNSTNLYSMLCRLLVELKIVTESTKPQNVSDAVTMVSSVLRNPQTPPLILFVDALNQFDDGIESKLVSWMPSKLAPRVRCVLSMIPGTEPHKSLTKSESQPSIININPLTNHVKKEIVEHYLKEYQKKLTEEEMDLLLAKKASSNPFWLSLACEELRVFGIFRKGIRNKAGEKEIKLMIPDKIEHLKDDLLGLLDQVLERFESEQSEEGKTLLISSLCMLEVSSTGLLESELRALLADTDNLLPSQRDNEEKGAKEKSEHEHPKFDEHLPAMKMAIIQRTLGSFLREYGDMSEGRLDFYHRSLSKVVRRRYLQEGSSYPDPKWWHQKLADYFEWSDEFDRKTEEYPCHLMALDDNKRLRHFLCEWSAVDRLYDPLYSSQLFSYWRQTGDSTLSEMTQAYSSKVAAMKRDDTVTKQQLLDRLITVASILVQAEETDNSYNLAEEALSLEKDHLGSRPRQMSLIYSVLADIWNKRLKKDYRKICEEALPPLKKCLSFNREAIKQLRKYKKTATNKQQVQSSLCKRYIQLSFNLCLFDQTLGTDAMTEIGKTAQDECNEVIEKAKKILEELGDSGSLADVMMNEALSLWRRAERHKQPKVYEEAWRLCLQSYGEYHLLSSRIQHNWAASLEGISNTKREKGEVDQADEYNKAAFDHFLKCYKIKVDVFGREHTSTKNGLGQLGKARFKDIPKDKELQLLLDDLE